MVGKNDKEQWRTIDGFEGIYKVSSYGRVWVASCVRHLSSGRTRRYGARFIKSVPSHTQSYPWVILCHPITRERHNVTIHTLVAETFLGPRPLQYEVNHKDGDKKNTKLVNLEWVTHQQNCVHAFQAGLRNSSCRFVTYQEETKTVAEWARFFGIKPQTLYARLDKGYPLRAAFDLMGYEAKNYARKRRIAAQTKLIPKYKDGLSSKEWAVKLGITRMAFLRRLRHYKDDDFIYRNGQHPRSGATKEER